MLRPATPLTLLLFCAFVLLLISVISTPVVRGIPLATYRDVSFGVFGYCSDSKGCSRVQIGYTTDGLWPASSDGDFNLPSSARHSLSSLLVVHPIAAFFCLVMTGLAAAAHFHSPSHSPRYLLALLILTLPTLLITLLAFLVDILLFIPHLAWGGWIVLASVILIVASGIMLCAMRRTLVSRKARKKRIAENAEMSGENFYNRQREEAKFATIPTSSTESKSPLVNGTPGADNLPSHTTYSVGRRSEEGRQFNASTTPVSPVSAESRYYSNPPRSNSRPPAGDVSQTPISQYGPSQSQEQQYPPQDGRGQGYPPNAYGRGRGYGPPRGRGGPGFRGGYGPNPRGGYRGPPPPNLGGRGSFGPDMRGGYSGNGRSGSPMGPMMAGGVGGAMMAGPMHRRPPPGYPPPQQSSGPSATQYAQGTQNYEPASPSDYGSPPDSAQHATYGGSQGQSTAKDGAPLYDTRRQSEDGLARAESPPPEMFPIGQAVELDATTGRASGYTPAGQGMAHLQGAQGSGNPHLGQAPVDYVPPRAGWNGSGPDTYTGSRSLNRPRGTSIKSDHSRYYEDVDPRFAEPEPQPAVPVPTQAEYSQPSMLQAPHSNHLRPNPESTSSLPHTESYENIPVGARSPATSEQSALTSISQRPVNPNWQPGHGGEFNQFGPPRRNDRSQVRQDMLLANNPDFELPGMGPPRGIRPVGRGGMRGGPMGGGVPRGALPPSALGLSGDGRYPDPVVPSGINSVRDV